MKPKRPNRRQAALGLAAALLSGHGLAVDANAHANAKANDSARWLPWPAERATPSLRLPDLAGQPWELAQQAGQLLLLNFWATWCAPCLAEMQSFEVLQQRLQVPRIQVVTVNFKEAREVVQRFRDAHGLSLGFVRDSYGEATRAWGVHTFPTTFVINPAGRALLRVEGEVDWGGVAAYAKLQALL